MIAVHAECCCFPVSGSHYHSQGFIIYSSFHATSTTDKMPQPSNSDERRRSLERKLTAYSAAAGASLLAAAGAQAQTIYADFPDTTLQFGTPIYLDLNQDGPPGLGFDALDDLWLQLGPQVENVRKGAGISSVLFLGALGNSYVSGLRILGTTSCNYGLALLQSSCSAVATANCGLPVLSSGAVSKGELIAIPNEIRVFPSEQDQFIRVGGNIISPPVEAGKAQGPVSTFEGWIRFNAQLVGLTPGDTATPFQVIVKDHAIFVNPGGPVSCDAASLPVEFTSFEALFNSGDLELSWETASEINNAGFEVQYRALDQDAFAPLDFVEGAGSTTEPQRYSYAVKDLDPGRYLFRLKQIDLDGAFKYTNNLEVTVEVPGTHFLSDAYPNPFNPQAQFSLVVPTEQNVRVELFDALGRSVSLLYDGVIEADTPMRFVVRGDDLPSGTYLYRATGETFSDAKQVALAK